MQIYFESLLRSHLILLIILLITFIIELITGKYIFVLWFKYKKDLKSAKLSAERETVLYFIFNLLYAIHLKYLSKNDISDFSLIFWIIIIFFLSFFFKIAYNKYQGKDPNKADFLGHFDNT
jgi:hypothetical protein